VNQGLIGKGLHATGSVGVYQYNGRLYLDWNNGWYATGIYVATGVWYHIAVVMDAVGRASSLRVFRASDNTIFADATTWSALSDSTTLDFRIGAFNDGTSDLDGKVDEVVVFKRLLGPDEIDAIRAATYPPAPAVTCTTGAVEAMYSLEGNVRSGAAAALALYSTVPFEDSVKVTNGCALVLYSTVPFEDSVKVTDGGILVLYDDKLRGIRKFPLPNPRLRYQTQFNCRKFPVAL